MDYDNSSAGICGSLPNMEDLTLSEGSEEEYDDEQIDTKIKNILKERRNGQYLPNDVIAHIEFFYNTLLMSHKTENPFANPKSYPALLY